MGLEKLNLFSDDEGGHEVEEGSEREELVEPSGDEGSKTVAAPPTPATAQASTPGSGATLSAARRVSHGRGRKGSGDFVQPAPAVWRGMGRGEGGFAPPALATAPKIAAGVKGTRQQVQPRRGAIEAGTDRPEAPPAIGSPPPPAETSTAAGPYRHEAPPALLEIGQQEFEKGYKLTWGSEKEFARLGQGVEGAVVLVMRRSDGGLFARKTAKKMKSADVDKQLVVLRTIAKSQHTNIVLPLVVEGAPGVVRSFIFELCDITLHDLFHKRRYIMDPGTTACLTRDMIRGLAHLHSLNIIHRDVKMDNMMLSIGSGGRYSLKLIDFGWSVSVDGAAAPKTTAFAEPYRPPEVVLGLEYGIPADVWAAGMLIRELVTGAPVHSTKKDMFDIIRHCASRPAPAQVPCDEWNKFLGPFPSPDLDSLQLMQEDSRAGDRLVDPGAADFVKQALQLLPEAAPQL
jgi:tRNA A-37 threonylcarbamoyl transferase component Bud32